FTNDLAALNDHTPHDERYSRLGEYTAIIQGLLASAEPFTFSGSYYQVHNLRLTPPLPPELQPGVLMSGSSEAGMQAARRLGATPIEYPKPVAEYAAARRGGPSRGLRIGLIARGTEAEAVAGYVNAGYRTFVLDVPASPAELSHIGRVFGLAVDRVAA